MRNTKRIAFVIAVILAVVTSVSMLAVTSIAAGSGAATLKAHTVTLESHGYQNTATAVSSENASGTLEDMLNTVAGKDPTTNTRYTITVSENAEITSPITLDLNEYEEVVVKLKGYSLKVSAPITVTGAGTFRIMGGFAADGSRSEITLSAGTAAILNMNGSGVAVMRDLRIDASALQSGAAFNVSAGILSIQSTELTAAAASEAAEISMVSLTGGDVEIKNSDLIDATELETAFVNPVISAGGGVYAEKSTITSGGTAITLKGDTASPVLVVDSEITAPTFISSENASSTAYVLGGKLAVSAISAGELPKEKLAFYFGTGNTTVVGADPAGYAIQSSCSFAEVNGSWRMSTTSTADAMSTIATLGSTPTVTTDTVVKTMAKTASGTAYSSYNRATAGVTTLLKDSSASGPIKGGSAFYANERYSLIIDLNGHTYTSTSTSASNFDVYGNLFFYWDGADADGKLGGYVFNSSNGMITRARSKSGIIANIYSVFIYTDTVYTLKHAAASATNQPFCIQSGDLYMSGCEISYSGTLSRTLEIVSISHSSISGFSAFIDDIKLKSTSDDSQHKIYFFLMNNVGTAWISNVECEGFSSFTSNTANSTITITDSKISTHTVPYGGTGGTTKISDTTTTIGDGAIAATASPTFLYGTGKTYIISDAELVGNYKVEEGYTLLPDGEGKFVVKSAENVVNASITMPAVFANGMVLQRNKEINIFGYCEQIGGTVEVILDGVKSTATVDENGRWCATFAPMKEKFGVDMEVRQVGENVAYNLKKIENINIGEIWIMSGQSNGDLQTFYMEDLKEYYDLAGTRTNIRMYRSSQGYSVTEKTIGSGTWYEATPENIASKSYSVTSIGYAMAAKLSDELGDDVPIAVMHLVRGSCKIKTWLDYEHIKEVSPSATREYEYWLGENSLPTNAHGGGAVATVMYNNVIAPLYGFEIAGVLWYQGEGDTGGGYFGSTDSKFRVAGEAEDEDNSYTEFFYALEDTFREAFGNDSELPFYVMQLSPFISSSYELANTYNLKMEQYEMCKNEPNTHLVSLGLDGAIIGGAFFNGSLDPDMGGASVSAQGFIHPTRKSTIGIRTADLILANEYGIKFSDVYTYPTPISAKVSADGVVTVTFDTELQYLYGDSALGFELYDGTKWVRAEGVISGNTVILSADGVANPKNVRYGCGEMLMELRDGTVIEVAGSKGATVNYKTDATNKTLTVTYNGVEYVIKGDTTDMIRSMDYGNITNASGAPVPLFKLDVVAE